MRLAFVDVETGGLDPHQHALLSIGAVAEDTQFEAWLEVGPGLTVTPGAAAVNGWPKAWDGHRLVSERDAITGFLAWLDHNRIQLLVAHNAPFDCGRFLTAAASRSLMDVNRLPRALCTMSIAHACKQLGRINPTALSLNAVAKSLGLGQNRSQIHGALEDALLCEQVYNAMLRPPPAPATEPAGKTRIGFGLGFGGMRSI